MENLEKGKKGEKLAKEYLLNKGYSIIAENWRSGRSEIDIIAKIENTLVFAEVKTRSTDYFGHPEESIGKQKKKILQRGANNFLEDYAFEVEVRFDVISIIITNTQRKIYHIEDAFFMIEDDEGFRSVD